ncbi:MAG TPA: MFS transporter [Burkholderiales bacterium]|nr:MFS transporter [Burkholderiales bacterium]
MTQIGKPPCDDAQIRHGEVANDRSPSAKRWVLAATIIGSSMAFIDGTIVNVALPAIQRDLGATASDMQWVIESYALFLASLLLFGGALGDHYGRRKVFMVGVALFAIASAGCAMAGNVTALIVARGIQGIGGALLVPGSLALISASFPEKERGRAIGTWSGFSGITAAIGPVLGGWLVDRYSWAWAFLINLPFALAVLVLCWRHVPESRSRAARALDWRGGLLATVALGGIVYAFIEAPARHWSSFAVSSSLLVGCVAFALFLIVEWRTREPMVPIALFRNRNFAGANLLTLWLYAALGGGLYFFPLNLIQVQGYSATAAGAALLPFIFIMFALSRWAGKLVDRVGSRLPLVVGPAIAACGFALFAWPGIGGSYWLTFFPAVVVLGLGMSVTVAPLTTTVMNSIGADMAGVASGVNNAVSRAAALLAIAGLGMAMAGAFDANLSTKLESIGATQEVRTFFEAQRGKLAGAPIPANMVGADAAALRRAIDESFVAGFRRVMLLSAGLALLSALGAWVVIEGRRPAQPARQRKGR